MSNRNDGGPSNEEILEWLDELREGVANQNSTAEMLATQAMASIRHFHINRHGTDACERCGLDLRNTFVHKTASEL